jgi:hypothetical protein
MWRRVLKPRVSIRVLMGLIAFIALGYGVVMILVEPYRKEWQAEQTAIAEIRAHGHTVGFTTTNVGPLWLQRLAWGHQQYFRRIDKLYFVGDGWEDYLERRSAFHHVKMVMQD